mgnify:FL=1
MRSDDENLKSSKKINEDEDKITEKNEKDFKTEFNSAKISLDNKHIKDSNLNNNKN